ncbi:hypothetical protein SKM57_12510 [Acinetobacter faecalis]|uniref:hypothetical protein n=1 Tax=Acinetobacter faecalis TaxID=2665161 RepID=UPI002A916429|nr:hypothetical protein [Acinetobacter faecalis]MDY6469397.1 hypothetical protein [Acinetobacter faecalis]
MKFFLITIVVLICLGCTSENKVENVVDKSTESNKVENVVDKSTENNARETCEDIELIAGVIMENRQYGTPMSKAMLILNKTDDEQFKQVLEKIIISAYEMPKFSTEANKQEAITDFKEAYFLGCYKDMIE